MKRDEHMQAGRTALITGATGGIGLELARQAARDRLRLVLVARRQAELDDLARQFREQHGVEVVTIVADLSEPDAADRVADELARGGIDVDLLVNNAGYASSAASPTSTPTPSYV